MGLFSFLGSLFGSKVSSKVIEEIRREISFAEAIKAHTAWKSRLQTALEGKGDETLLPAHICEDNRCVPGVTRRSRACAQSTRGFTFMPQGWWS